MRPTPNSSHFDLRPRSGFLGCILLLFLAACREGEEWSPLDGAWNPNHPEAAAILSPPDPGTPIWTQMADAGEHWYRVRGCLACHRTDGVDVAGPALNGVTRRRSYDWFRAMTLRPDSMLVHDPIAQELLAIYRLPMPVQRVNDLHVRAIWEYLRTIDEPDSPLSSVRPLARWMDQDVVGAPGISPAPAP